MKARRAQLLAEAVAVLCPACSEPQPSPDNGSEFWTAEDFARGHGTRPCASCDQPLIIETDSKVSFR